MGINTIVTIIVTVRLLSMLWIGWYSSTKISVNTDFMVAGRRLDPLLMARTLAATKIDGGSSLGVVQNGMSGYGLSASWYITTMGIAFIILSSIASKLRTTTVKTVPEYLRRRYGRSCGVTTVVTMLLPLVSLTVGQFIAPAVILSTTLNIDYQVAVIIVVVVVTIYSIMGGLWSVTLTDFVQVFLIVIGMIIAIPFAMNYAGGWSQITADIPEGTLNMLQSYDLPGIISPVIMYTATFSIGQEAVSHFCAARDEKAAKGGAWLAALVNFIYAFIPTILGIITLALVNMGKSGSTQFESVDARYALPVLAINTVSALICGLLLAGTISATMSSSDSDLPGAGSIFVNDICKAVLKPDASSQSVMTATKMVMRLVDVASMLIALFNTQSIVSILMFCFTLRAVGSFFPYVMGHYWEKVSTAGTIASLIAGTVVAVYLEHVSKGILFEIKFSQPIISGLAVAFTCFVIFPYATPPKMAITELVPEEDDRHRVGSDSSGSAIQKVKVDTEYIFAFRPHLF